MWKRGFILLWILANEGIKEGELVAGVQKQLQDVEENLNELVSSLLEEHYIEKRDDKLYMTDFAKKYIDLILDNEDSARFVFSEYIDKNGNKVKGIRSYNLAYSNNDVILYDFYGDFKTYKTFRDTLGKNRV